MADDRNKKLSPFSKYDYFLNFYQHAVNTDLLNQQGKYKKNDLILYNDDDDERSSILYICPKNQLGNEFIQFFEIVNLTLKSIRFLEREEDDRKKKDKEYEDISSIIKDDEDYWTINSIVNCASLNNVISIQDEYKMTLNDKDEIICNSNSCKNQKRKRSFDEDDTMDITDHYNIQDKDMKAGKITKSENRMDTDIDPKSNLLSILEDFVNNKTIIDERLKFGILENILRDTMPFFSIIPLHCLNKLQIIETILTSAVMCNLDKSFIYTYDMISNHAFKTLNNVFTIETYFNENNEIIMPENSSNCFSAIFVLCKDVIQCRASREKQIPPIYMKCKERPVISNKVLLLRSYFIHIFSSYFPNPLPNRLCDILKDIALERDMLLTLLNKRFMIEILSIAFAYKSMETKTTDILEYYLKCVEYFSVPIPVFRSLSCQDLNLMLAGLNSETEDMDTDDSQKYSSSKFSILNQLNTHMIALEDFLIYDDKHKYFTVPIYYEDAQRKLRIGCLQNKVIIGREGNLGQDITVYRDFGLDDKVVKNLNVSRDKKLISALLLEATNTLNTARYLISKLFQNKVIDYVLNEFHISCQISDDDINEKLFKTNPHFDLDLFTLKDEYLNYALNEMYENQHSSLCYRNQFGSNDMPIYVIYFENRYYILPKNNDNNDSFTLYENELNHIDFQNVKTFNILEWLINRNEKINNDIKIHFIKKYDNESHLSNLIKSMETYERNFKDVYEILLNNIYNSLKQSYQSNLDFPSHITSFNSLVDFMAENLNEKVKSYSDFILAFKKPSIFSLPDNLGYITFDSENKRILFLGKDSLLPYSDQLRYLNVLENIDDEKWIKFLGYPIMLQQLYWRYILSSNYDLFRQYLSNLNFNSALFRSFNCDTIQLLAYDMKHNIENIFQKIIKETLFGDKCNIFEIVEGEMKSNKNISHVLNLDGMSVYVSNKTNQPYLILLEGNDHDVVDILLLQYFSQFKISLGFAFIQDGDSETYKLAMLRDDSEQTKRLFRLRTVQDVFDFFQNLYGSYIYTHKIEKDSPNNNISDDDNDDDIIMYKEIQGDEIKILTYLNMWNDKLQKRVNSNYDIFPAIFRFAFYLFPNKALGFEPYITQNYSLAMNNVLQYNNSDIEITKTLLPLDKDHSILLYKSPREVNKALGEKGLL